MTKFWGYGGKWHQWRILGRLDRPRAPMWQLFLRGKITTTRKR